MPAMEVFHSISAAHAWMASQGCAVTIGNFDGVHLGHQQVLAELRGHALAVGGASVVVTFEPHPRAVLFPDEAPRRLADQAEKLRLLETLGIDAALVLPFNKAVAAKPADVFMRELFDCLGFSHIHVGYDFAFGQGRAGHIDTLRSLGDAKGFTVSEASAFEMRGGVVSSSRIRSAVEAADFALVDSILGRRFSICGDVVHGEKRGRAMGFPTANMHLDQWAHPPAGIYAVQVSFPEQADRAVLGGAAYIGYRPTFHGRSLLLETHVLDVSDDFYGKRMEVTFVQRIREDRAFTGVDDLAQQIRRDCQQAREILSAIFNQE